MTTSKSPFEAQSEFTMLKNVVFWVVMVGFVFYSAATAALGFYYTDLIWLCALLVAAGFWFACHSFSTNPNQGLLAVMRILMALFIFLWVGAAIATFADMDADEVWAVLMGILLCTALTYLSVRMSILGSAVVGVQAPPHVGGPPAYGSPVPPGAPPAYPAPTQSAAPPYAPVGQPPAAGSGPVCPSCGRPSAPGTKFCPYDGTPIAQGCPSCGYVSAPGMQFCAMCGGRLSSS